MLHLVSVLASRSHALVALCRQCGEWHNTPKLPALQAAADEDQAPDIPEGLPLSTAKLHDDGVYLFENGFEALIFIQRKASPQLLRPLFGEGLKAAQLAVSLSPLSHELSSPIPLKTASRTHTKLGQLSSRHVDSIIWSTV